MNVKESLFYQDYPPAERQLQKIVVNRFMKSSMSRKVNSVTRTGTAEIGSKHRSGRMFNKSGDKKIANVDM